ncbi:hypothetical protein JHK82_033236 [Glycine max]|uniref:HECT-type E3 ubiquitin transferase n=1 Tax=Glycine max TaxID=3847 RepID=K7LTW2_SOYBN|nr:hypothetical protein JHK87_033173 [Glycine soja]KAG4980000.1 hypothetical protein JHK85_033958 [Glycine max]KAG4985634.1 hypothetical protein JHK86_033325 [Glycine max]KAG5118816.1 hypothetical protein JHK82_033236 [Glycine max]KAG5139807.1 hypothetical protein JHK84_033575 [Glycine max]
MMHLNGGIFLTVDDLKANTEYTGYTVASNVVQWFWEVVKAFNKEDMARLLQFVTGTSKVRGLQEVDLRNTGWGVERERKSCFLVLSGYSFPPRRLWIRNSHNWEMYNKELEKPRVCLVNVKILVSNNSCIDLVSTFNYV